MNQYHFSGKDVDMYMKKIEELIASNTKLAEQIIASCGANTRLSIACDITSKEEYIRTATIAEWRKIGVPDINKRPTIFIIGEN